MSSLLIPSYTSGFARCAAESENPGLWKGLVGLWVPSLGPTGLTLRDWSGFGNHGTLINMDPATDWVAGEKGWALNFRAGPRGVTCGSDASLAIDKICVAGWIWQNGNASRMTPFGKGYLEYDCFFYEDTSTNIRLFYGDGVDYSFSNYNPTIDFTDGWHHFAYAVHRSVGTVYIWIDGQRGYTGGSTARGVGGSNNFEIGRRAGGGNYWNGRVANAVLYNRFPQDSEIQHLYADRHALTRLRSRVYPAAAAPAGGLSNILGGGIVV